MLSEFNFTSVLQLPHVSEVWVAGLERFGTPKSNWVWDTKGEESSSWGLRKLKKVEFDDWENWSCLRRLRRMKRVELRDWENWVWDWEVCKLCWFSRQLNFKVELSCIERLFGGCWREKGGILLSLSDKESLDFWGVEGVKRGRNFLLRLLIKKNHMIFDHSGFCRDPVLYLEEIVY